MIGAKRNQGIALVMALLMAVVVGIIVLGSLQLSIINRQISANDSLSNQALNVARAGSAYWKSETVALFQYMLNHFDQYQDDYDAYMAAHATDTNPLHHMTCNNYFIMGLDLNRDGTIELGPGYNRQTLPDISIPVGAALTGTARVTFQVSGSNVVLISEGSVAGARATIQENFTLAQVNPWNNAVFASETAAGATIKGRAEIRGPVHILGEGESPSATVLDMNGTFGIGNTYENLTSSIANDIVGSQNIMRLTAQKPSDLCATLRIKNGKVVMKSAAASIGADENQNPDPYKDQMQGIYTNGAFSDVSSDAIYSVNGKDAAYDVGELYDFPNLTDVASDFDYANGSFLGGKAVFPAKEKPWQDKIRDNSLVLATGNSPVAGTSKKVSDMDDRASGRVLLGNAMTIPGLVGSQLGKTYLSADCFTGTLFGSSATLGTTILGISTTTVLPPPSSGYVLEYGSNPFSCTKYRVTNITEMPNAALDEVVTQVVWSGNSTSRTVKLASGANKPLKANELYVGGTGGGVMFYGANFNLQSGSGSNPAIRYYGRGTFVAEDSNREATASATGGEASFKVDFLPATNNAWALASDQSGRAVALEPNIRNTYPATAIIGFVARNRIETDVSQGRFTTALYAENSVDVSQQSVIAGAIMTKGFDASSQVPTILYVPNLTSQLPGLMPGAGKTQFTVSNVAWTRRPPIPKD